MAEKRKHITQKQIIEVSKKLEEVLRRVIGNDSLFEYISGYDDHRVATECDVSTNSVRGLRQNVYGNLKDHDAYKNKKGNEEVLKQLQNLNARITALEIDLGLRPKTEPVPSHLDGAMHRR